MRLVANGDQPVEAVAHRHRQTLRHALRQQGACLVPGRPHRTAQHRVGRRENVFVPKPASRPRQQRRRAVEPQRFVFEEPRQPFADGVVERAQTQVLTDALLMLGDRLLPAGVGVDRLGVGPQLQGREPQDLPVDLQGRLFGLFAGGGRNPTFSGSRCLVGGSRSSSRVSPSPLPGERGGLRVGFDGPHERRARAPLARAPQRRPWPNSGPCRPSTRPGATGCPSPWPTPGPPSSSRASTTSTSTPSDIELPRGFGTRLNGGQDRVAVMRVWHEAERRRRHAASRRRHERYLDPPAARGRGAGAPRLAEWGRRIDAGKRVNGLARASGSRSANATVAGLKAARARGRRGEVRADESSGCGWPRPRWRTATRRCPRCAGSSASGR